MLMKLHVVPMLALLALFAPCSAKAEGGAVPVWMTGLNPGDAPQEVHLGLLTKPAAQDAVLWQEGHPLVLIKAGAPLPKAMPEGRICEVTLKSADGKPLPGVALQWKPPGLPNLPEPFGRTRSDKNGVAGLPLLPGQGAVVWIEDVRFLPAITTVAPDTSSLSLSLAPAPGPVIVVQGPYGRLVAGAKLATLPLEGFKDLLGMAFNRTTLQKLFTGDEVGRISIPADLRHACGCLQAEGYSLLDVPSTDAMLGRVALLAAAKVLQVTAKDQQSGAPVKGLKWELQAAPSQLPWLHFDSEGLWQQGAGFLAPPAYPCRLALSAPGYVPYKESQKEFPPSGRLDITLAKGVRLAGKIVARDGRPVAGAIIQAGPYEDGVNADSDKNGAFALPPISYSKFPMEMTIYADNCVQKVIPGLPPRDNLSMTIVMESGASVSGRVVDEDSRQPIAKAQVFCLWKEEGRTSSDTTKENGAFSIGGLAPGSYEIHFTAAGSVGKTRTFIVVANEPHDLGEIALSSHPKVTGHLVDQDGNAVSSNAEVRLECYIGIPEIRDREREKSLTGTIADDGAFQFRGVPVGRYRLVASAGEAKKVIKSVIVNEDDVDVGKVALEPASSLIGTLRARSQLDLSSWRVSLLTQRFDFDPVTSFTDDSGAFTFEGLPAGVYRLAAYAPLHVLPDAMARVVIQSGQDAKIVVPVGGVTVTAFVLVDGTPAPGAKVTVSGISDEAFDGTMVLLVTGDGDKTPLGLPAVTRTATADETGRVVLDQVEPGAAQVSLAQNGQYYKMMTAIPDDPQAPLSWNFSGLVLTGHVAGVDGTPAADILVSIAYQGVGVMAGNSAVTDASGAFRFTGLGEGTLTLTARNQSGASASATVELKAGQPPPPVELRLAASPPAAP
jgi:hypothetical protein